MRAAARSAKFANFLANRAIWSQSRRTYLSAQYSCEKEWEEAKKSDPLLKNINSESLFVDTLRKIASKQQTSIALDVDIFVNSVESRAFIDEVGNILNR